MSVSPKIEKSVEWYSQKRASYDALTKKAESIIRELLDSEGINFHSITSRAKTIESYQKRLLRKNMQNQFLKLKT